MRLALLARAAFHCIFSKKKPQLINQGSYVNDAVTYSILVSPIALLANVLFVSVTAPGLIHE